MSDDDGHDSDGPDEQSGGYDVGYGRPPKHSRFPKGQSGNPKGRRKGSRALKTDLDQALKQTLTITVGGKKRRGTTQALMMYALAVKAATGDLKAAKLLGDLVLTVFGAGDRGGGEAKLSAQDAELLERMLDRFEPDDELSETGDVVSPDQQTVKVPDSSGSTGGNDRA